MANQRNAGSFFGIFEELVARGVGEPLPNTVPWLPELYPIMAQGQENELNPVRRAAQESGSPILELGCGTGRLLLPLAREGYDVTGVESNPRMLGILNARISAGPERVRRRVQVLPVNMLEFRTEDRFKLAFLSANTFLYLVTPENQKKALRRIHEHLEPGGLLSVDVYLPANGWGSGEPFCRTAHDRQTGKTVLYVAQAKYDRVHGSSHLNAASILFQPDQPPKIWVQSWKEASLTPKETRLMLESCGFEIVRVEGDYNGGPLTPESVQVVTVARKVGG